MELFSVNPFSLEIMGSFQGSSFKECRAQIGKSRRAFLEWKGSAVSERIAYLEVIATHLTKNKPAYAQTITREMGKPIKQSYAEIDKCARLCEYYAEHLDAFLQEETIRTDGKKSYVRFEPLGLILGIMPWNFPFWQVFRFAIPTLMAGNVCLLKHASNVPGTALALEKLFADSGLPMDVFKMLLMDADAARRLIAEDLIDGVSLTGSVEAGSEIAAAAGRSIKKVVLELGGSDPFIVLEDADISKAARIGLKARMVNSGQSCIAAKRFLVMKPVATRFVEMLTEEIHALRIGDPMDTATDIGPLAKRELLQTLERQLKDALEKGARVIWGPELPKSSGLFFRPALITDASPDMAVMKEEVFGPVAAVATAETVEAVVEMANATSFGLGAAIWSEDIGRAQTLVAKIQAGFVAVNDLVQSDPRLPFGGIKKSGLGRELSHYGLREFVNIKTVVIQGE